MHFEVRVINWVTSGISRVITLSITAKRDVNEEGNVFGEHGNIEEAIFEGRKYQK